MIRPLYSLMVIGAQPFLRRKLKRRGAAEPGYLHAMDERFGVYRTTAEPGALWIHAVSLGETRAAAILKLISVRLGPNIGRRGVASGVWSGGWCTNIHSLPCQSISLADQLAFYRSLRYIRRAGSTAGKSQAA